MKIILSFALLLPFFIFAQNKESDVDYSVYEILGKRVFINKTVISYNFSLITFQNNVEISKQEFVNFEKPVPSTIKISSDQNNSTIRINSKYLKEDFFFEFKRIYKLDNGDGTFMYYFLGKSSCDVTYFIPKGKGNQFLDIKCLDKNKNGNEISYTMSRNEQL